MGFANASTLARTAIALALLTSLASACDGRGSKSQPISANRGTTAKPCSTIEACYEMAKQKASAQEFHEAIALATQACELGSAKACLLAGRWIAKHAPQQIQERATLYELGCQREGGQSDEGDAACTARLALADASLGDTQSAAATVPLSPAKITELEQLSCRRDGNCVYAAWPRSPWRNQISIGMTRQALLATCGTTFEDIGEGEGYYRCLLDSYLVIAKFHGDQLAVFAILSKSSFDKTSAPNATEAALVAVSCDTFGAPSFGRACTVTCDNDRDAMWSWADGIAARFACFKDAHALFVGPLAAISELARNMAARRGMLQP